MGGGPFYSMVKKCDADSNMAECRKADCVYFDACAVELHEHLTRVVSLISSLGHHSLINHFLYCIYWLHTVHLASQQGALETARERNT